MTLEEAVKTIAEAEDQEVAVEALHKGAPRIWQGIFDMGHGKRTAETSKEIKDLKKALEDEKASHKASTDRIAELESGDGDLDKEREKFKQDLQREREAAELKIADMNSKLKKARERRVEDELVLSLTDPNGHGLNAKYARMIARESIQEGRIKFDPEDVDSYEVLGKGMNAAPIQGSKDATPLQLLAKEMSDEADDVFRVSKADQNGSGHKGGGKGDEDPFEAARKRAEERQKGSTDSQKAVDTLLNKHSATKVA
jgi:vacuolar-type H+-ATPase subunit I/STV1